MIKDLELIKNIAPLFEKEIVIWGLGYFGQKIYDELRCMGAGKKGILFVDSDCGKVGKYTDYEILAPQELADKGSDYIIIISVEKTEIQEAVIEQIQKNQIQVDVYTKFAFFASIYLNLRDSRMDKNFREKIVWERQTEKFRMQEIIKMQTEIDILKYFTFAPLHNEMILIYQPGKVGSKSIRDALEDRGKYTLHVHSFNICGYRGEDIRRILQKNHAKIITMVREPVARSISDLWENILNFKRCSDVKADFDTIEKQEFYNWANYEFEWFDKELKSILGIDIYEYEFDPNQGYTIIEEDGLSILVLKTEKLNQLQEVIGQFVGDSEFKLKNRVNDGSKKQYRYAYNKYKEQFKIAREVIDGWYDNNKKVDHFYSMEEKKYYLQKWKDHIKE